MSCSSDPLAFTRLSDGGGETLCPIIEAIAHNVISDTLYKLHIVVLLDIVVEEVQRLHLCLDTTGILHKKLAVTTTSTIYTRKRYNVMHMS